MRAIETFLVVAPLPVVVQDGGIAISYAPGQTFRGVATNDSIARLLEQEKIVRSVAGDQESSTGYTLVVGPPGPTGPVGPTGSGGGATLSVTLGLGNTTGANDIIVNTGRMITGAAELLLAAAGANPLHLRTNGTNRWSVTSAGHLVAVADNTYDIGATGATRPRRVYVGTEVVVGNTVTIGTASVVGSGALAITATGADLALSATGSNNITMSVSATERVRVDSGGTVIIGDGTAGAWYAGGPFPPYSLVTYRNTNNLISPYSFSSTATDQSYLTFARARGTAASPAACVNNDSIGQITFAGFSSATNGSNGATIRAEVDGAVVTNELPGRLIFATTPIGLGTPVDRWTIKSTGHFLAGADNAYDIGATGTARPRRVYVGTEIVVGSTVTIGAGAGTPEGAITAPVGSVFLRSNGTSGSTLYTKSTGAGNTGWEAVSVGGGGGGGGGESLAATLAIGNTTGANNIVISNTQRLTSATDLLIAAADNGVEDADGYDVTMLGGNALLGFGSGGRVILTSGLPVDGNGGFSGDVQILSGITSTFSSGESSGGVLIQSGEAAGQSGAVDITTGAAQNGTGGLTISTGSNAGISNSGSISISTGSGYGVGNITISTPVPGPGNGANIGLNAGADLTLHAEGNVAVTTEGEITLTSDIELIRFICNPGTPTTIVDVDNSGLHVTSGGFYANNDATLCLSANNVLAFFGAAGAQQATVTGSRGGNAALASLLTALADHGLIVDSSSA